jgi:hypothetical protein
MNLIQNSLQSAFSGLAHLSVYKDCLLCLYRRANQWPFLDVIL